MSNKQPLRFSRYSKIESGVSAPPAGRSGTLANIFNSIVEGEGAKLFR